MRKRQMLLAAGLFLAAVLPVLGALDVRVAPNGDDAADGTAAHPLRTMRGARDFLRAHRGGEAGATVTFADGVYALDAAVEFSASDAGDRGAPVVYRAEHRGRAVLRGSQALAWRKLSADDKNFAQMPASSRGRIWVADIGGEAPIMSFLGGALGNCGCPISVFADGRRLQLAQYPEKDLLTVGKFTGEKHFLGPCVGDVSLDGVFEFDSPLMKTWAKEPELWAHGYWVFLWSDLKSRVLRVDPEGKIMAVEPHRKICCGFKDKVAKFRLINVFSAMDRPGKWCIDRTLRRIYAWPPSDSTASLTVALTDHVIAAKGVSYMAFDGLTVEGSRDTALVFADCTNVVLRALTVRQTSGWGVRFEGGRQCRAVGCDLYDLGEGGVLAKGGELRTLEAAGHLVDNCHIHHYGQVIANGRAGVSLGGVGCRATHNLVHHAQHNGITFGGNDHVIGYNVVHDTCMFNDDAGAIYCCQRDWTLRGNVVEYNLVHANGIQPHPKNTPGIYLDDYSSGTIVRGNIVSAASAGIWICGGNHNVVERNIVLAADADGIVLASRGAETSWSRTANQGRDSYLYRKLAGDPIYRSEKWMSRYPGITDVLDLDDSVFAHNALYNTIASNAVVACGTDVRTCNWDKVAPHTRLCETLVAEDDPGFVDYAGFDWRLRPGTKVQRLLGDSRFERMGLYPSPHRSSPAVKFGAGRYPIKPFRAWMPGKVGVFAHYLPTDEQFRGNRSFDVVGLVRQLKEMKADYFMLTLGQNNGNYCSPNATYETLGGVPRHTRCSKRDIPAEIIAGLKGSGIRFGLYLPCQPSREDRTVVGNFGLSMENVKWGDHYITSEGAEKWARVIEEWSRRYGRDVSLWWFDGAYTWLGLDDAVAAAYRKACLRGNPEAQVSFNAGVRLKGAERQSDYWAGEENDPLTVLPTSRWHLPGVQWQVLTFMGKGWGKPDCRFADEQLADWVSQATSQGGMVTLDMHMDYVTGCLEPAQVEQFARVRAAVLRANGKK